MKPKHSAYRILQVFLSLAAFCAVPAVRAASGGWNADASGNWSSAGNWTPAAAPGTSAGDVINLGKDITAARTVTIDSTSRTAGTLNIGDPATSFFAYTLAASGGAGLTIDNNGSGASLVQASTTAADLISAPVTLADNLTINNSGTGGLTLSGIISGASKGIVKTGTGTLTLNGTAVNTFTGGLAVNAGTVAENFTNLAATPNLNMLDGGNVLTLGGGTLSLTGKSNIASTQNFASTTLSATGQGPMSKIALGRQGAGSMTVALGSITRNAGGTLNFSSVPDTGTVIATTANTNDASGILGPWATVGSTTTMKYATVDGSGRIISYGNGTVGTAGTLANVTDPNGNFYQTGATILANNISANTLRCTDNTTFDNKTGGAWTMTLNGMLFVGSSWTTFGNTPAQGGGDLIIGSNKELFVIVQSGQNLGFTPRIVDNPGGASSLTWCGGGECSLYANTYSGGTTLNGVGQMNMADPASFGTGPVTVNGGRFNVSYTNKTINCSFTFNGCTWWPGYGNTFSGPIYLAVDTTIDFANWCTFSATGVVSGPGGLTKASGGQLTIQSVNTYTGPTILSAGTIVMGAGASLNNTSRISLAGGTTFDVSAITSYALSGTTVLAASGAASAATLKGKAGGTVNLGSQPVNLTFTPTVFTGDTARPALTVSQGTLALSNNTIGVNIAAASPLGIGTYRLIHVTSGTTAGTPNPTPVITGTGLAAGTRASLAVSGGNVVLTVAPITFQVEGLPNPQSAGAAGSVTVTAKDEQGNTLTGYTGTVHFTSSDGAAVVPLDHVFVPGDNGTHVFPGGVTFKTAGTQSVTATDTVIATITGTQSGIVVNPAAVFVLTVTGMPANQAATSPASVTVTAKDSYGNTVTGYTGTVYFTSSDGAAVLPSIYTFVPGDNGTHTFTNGVTFNTVGAQSVTVIDTVTGTITGTQSGITVLPGTAAITLFVTGLPNPQTAGAAGSITVTAKTVTGTTATGYVGTVHFISTDGQAVLPLDHVFVPSDNGTHTFGSVILKTAGAQSITATDTVTAINGTQSGITVNPAAAAVLTVSGFPNPQWAGAAGGVTITAKDAYNNTAAGYAGTVRFTSSDGAASLPGNHTFVAGDYGSHNFPGSVILNTIGAQSITATDTVTGAITGTQTGIVVNLAPTSFTWIATAATGNWSDVSNWSNNLGLSGAPLAGGRADYTLNFSKSGTYASTDDLGDGFVLNRINFTNAWWSNWSGNSLVFTANGATLPQMNLNTALTGGLTNPLVLAANLTIGGSGGGEFGLSGLISGTGGLTLSGATQLNLSNAGNTYAGGTIINNGNVAATTANTLGTGAVTIHGNGKLSIGNSPAMTNSLTMNGGTLNLTYWNTVSGPFTLAATSTIATGTGYPNITSAISGAGGLTSTGNLILKGDSTYSGPTSIPGGSLQVATLNRVDGGTATSNLGAPTTTADGTILLGSTTLAGSLVYTGPGETTDRIIKLAGTTGGAVLTQFGTCGVYPAPRGDAGLLKFTSDVAIPGTPGADSRKTLTLTHATSGTIGNFPGHGEISGGIGDSITGNAGQLTTSITKAGIGTWTLSGANSYSGATRIQAGTLVFTRSDALGGGPLDITGGARVRLDYVGTRQISALTYDGGGSMPNGTYGSASSRATFKDDTRFAGIGTVTVGPISFPTATTLVRTTGGDPSNGGNALTFTATVTGTAPTGNVVFHDGLTVIGSVTLNGSFQASLSTGYLAGGRHAITALYTGAAGNASSASTPLSQTIVEGRPATTTAVALTGGSNPSNVGAAVTFTATVTGTAPTGMVTFYDGTSTIGTVVLNGAGQASLTTSSLPVGWRPIKACYSGDTANAPGASASALFQTVNPSAGNDKVKVFILAGQSNMVGHSSVENGRDVNNLYGPLVPGGLGSLRHMLNANPDKYGYLSDPAHPNPAGYAGWLKRGDVSVAYWGESNGLNRKGILDADFGDNGGLGNIGPAYNGAIGPEYGFGLVVGSQLGDPVLLIKYAFGGKSLKVDYRPPSSGGTTGSYYTGMVARVREVLDNISTYVVGYAGQGYEIAGFGWHQGWNDSGEPVLEYETNLCNLIKDLRAEFNVPNMPVSVGITGMAQSSCATVIQAQLNVGNPSLHPEFAGTVTSVDTRPFDFGELLSPSGDATHWNWNAESYFNVGESMGLAMAAMLQAIHETSYDVWARTHGLTAGANDGPQDDPDHDGIPNLMEYVLGGLPMATSHDILPVVTSPTAGGNWIFEFDRSADSRPPDTTQVVEYGGGLAYWQQVVIPLSSSGSVEITPGATTDHVSVTLPVLGAKGFARLKVTR